MPYTPVSCGTVHSFRDTRTMPYTPVSCGTGHSFRGTRNMPYTPVSCVTGHSFRGTRTMPYAYCGSECQSERTPALGDRTPSGVVCWTAAERYSRFSETEWENEGIRGRLKAERRAQWNQENDDQAEYPRVRVNNENWALNLVHCQGKIDFAVQLDDSSRRLPFCGGIIQFWTTNQEQPKSTFAQTNREIARKFQMQLMRNQRNSPRTAQLCNKGHHLLESYSFIRIGFFCVSNSCSTVISEWFFNHLEGKRFCVETFFDLGKRLLQSTRVQSRSRGVRTIPCTHWGSECQGQRAPALGERYGRYRGAEWENEGSWGRPETDQRASWNCATEECTDEKTNQPRVWANAENWALNQFSWQEKNDFTVPLNNSSSRLSFCRGIRRFWTTKQEHPKSTFAPSNREIERFQMQLMTTQRNSIIKQDSCTTKDQPFHGITFFHSSRSIFFVSFIRVSLWSMSDSLSIQMENFGWVGILYILQKDIDQLCEWNQDLVAPAPCFIPLWAAGLFNSSVALALRENVFWCCVFNCSRVRNSRHS